MIKQVGYIEMYCNCVTTVRRLVDVCLCATHGENLIWPDGQAIRLFHLSDANNDDMLTMTELQHIFADFDNNSRNKEGFTAISCAFQWSSVWMWDNTKHRDYSFRREVYRNRNLRLSVRLFWNWLKIIKGKNVKLCRETRTVTRHFIGLSYCPL